MLDTKRGTTRRFQLILIKPSHYDDDGYVMQWFRSTMPSNSLAAVYGLAIGAAERQRARPRSAHRRHAIDETNTRIVPKKLIAPHRRARRARAGRHRRRAIQRISPRGRYRPAAARGRRPVMIGGFHVSGCLSMLQEIPTDIQAGAGAWHLDLRRRSRGAYRRGAERRRARHAPAALQLHEGPAGHRQQSPPRPSCLSDFVKRTVGNVTELRCRPRLPVPMLVLHHHQRAGTQIALPLA